MRAALVALAITALSLCLPGLALAGTVSLSGSAITYQADQATGSAENVGLGIEAGMAFVTSDVGVTSGDCTQTDPNRVDCPLRPTFVVFLLGFEDSLSGDQITGAETVEGHGGGGGDDLTGGPNADKLFGDDGDDRLFGAAGNDTLEGGAANDGIDDGAGDDTVTGGPGDDRWTAGAGRDAFAGGDGTDLADYSARTAAVTITLDGAADDGEPGEGDLVGADVEDGFGGAGNDRIVGGAGPGTLRGGRGNDDMTGGPRDDRIEGDDGDDFINSRDGGYDSVDCGQGTDTVLADPVDGLTGCELSADRDNDGALNDVDCAPDDPAIRPGGTEVPGNPVDEDCAGGPLYLPVGAGLVFSVTKQRAPAAIRWKRLRVTRLEAGDTVQVRCRGRGCAFKRATRRAASGRAALDLAPLFKKRFLRVGTTVEIRVLHAGQIGSVYVLRVAKGPKVKRTVRCLPVGASAPAPC